MVKSRILYIAVKICILLPGFINKSCYIPYQDYVFVYQGLSIQVVVFFYQDYVFLYQGLSIQVVVFLNQDYLFITRVYQYKLLYSIFYYFPILYFLNDYIKYKHSISIKVGMPKIPFIGLFLTSQKAFHVLTI